MPRTPRTRISNAGADARGQMPAIRLPLDITSTVEQEARRMESERPGSHVSRAEAVRVLVMEALAARQKQGRK